CIRDDWFEPLNIFTVTALPPGERKSAAFAAAVRPVQLYERHLRQQAAPDIAEAESERRQLDARLKSLEGRIGKCNDPGEAEQLPEPARAVARQVAEFVVPVLPILYADDETPESLARLLADQGGRMLISAPEGTALEIAKGRYSESPVFDTFLKGHAGDP